MLRIVLVAMLLCIAAEDGEPTLAWKKDEGETLFKQGKELFAQKKYMEAAKVFKDAHKFAKGRVTKGEVRRWREGSVGGFRLGEMQKLADAGNFQSAYAQAENYYKGYQDTPIGKEYDAFIESLRGELFHSLENFDRATNRFSEEHGKTFVDDKEFVKQGARALKWETVDHPATLKVKEVPRDLTRFRAVSFWINFPKSGMKYWVVFKGAGKSQAGYGKVTDNTFSKQMNFKKGWNRVEIPLKDFTQYGKIEWTQIKDFRIYFEQKRKITVYLDDIALVKK